MQGRSPVCSGLWTKGNWTGLETSAVCSLVGPLWQGCEHCNRVTCVGDRSCAEVEACRVRWLGEGSSFEAVAVGVGLGFAWQPDHGMRFGGGEGGFVLTFPRWATFLPQARHFEAQRFSLLFQEQPTSTPIQSLSTLQEEISSFPPSRSSHLIPLAPLVRPPTHTSPSTVPTRSLNLLVLLIGLR
jgi:hypothetical protein